MDDVRQPLRDAMRKRKWSVRELLERSTLTCDRSSLQKKLFGYKRGRKRVYQTLTVEECQAHATALDVRVAVGMRRAA
jgi:hypothetical protein